VATIAFSADRLTRDFGSIRALDELNTRFRRNRLIVLT